MTVSREHLGDLGGLQPRPQPPAVLLVDDDPDCRALIREGITQLSAGIRIYEAANGQEALQLLSTGDAPSTLPRPSLIFLDLEMPQLDGLATLRRIRSDPAPARHSRGDVLGRCRRGGYAGRAHRRRQRLRHQARRCRSIPGNRAHQCPSVARLTIFAADLPGSQNVSYVTCAGRVEARTSRRSGKERVVSWKNSSFSSSKMMPISAS